jgi:ketosteroid isomerase-like protein
MSDEARRDAFERVLAATATAEADGLAEILDEEFTAWSPSTSVSSRDELLDELRERDAVLSEVVVGIDAMHLVDDRGYAEWVISGIHAGAYEVDDEIVIEATGNPVTIRGISVVEFAADDRITELRQYWDEVGLLEAIGLLDLDDD